MRSHRPSSVGPRRQRPQAALVIQISGTVMIGMLGLWLMLRRHGSAATVGGFLLGAAVVALMEALTTWREQIRVEEEARVRGLDETRRLLYAARMAVGHHTGHDSWMLGGTVANAVAHHWRRRSQPEAFGLGSRIASGTAGDQELQDVIDEITAELGDGAPGGDA